jgi:hypothetical protein
VVLRRVMPPGCTRRLFDQLKMPRRVLNAEPTTLI